MAPKKLRILCDLAEMGSWAATARNHRVSVQEIMELVWLLEDCLGVPLFRRNTKSLILTPEGRMMVEAARRMLAYHAGSEDRDVKELSLSFEERAAGPSPSRGRETASPPRTVSTKALLGELDPDQHLVQIYHSDQEFADSLERFVLGGLMNCETVVLIATQPHLHELGERLMRAGCDIENERMKESLILLDAEESLAQFMVLGWPDEERFTTWISGRLAHARRSGRRVRAFGEMVAILWERGQNEATIRLEQLWNIVLQREKLPLLCAYPSAAFCDDQGPEYRDICGAHSHLVA
jgi:molybdenum-dependent DNA-binding transcriptional regulator ModE